VPFAGVFYLKGAANYLLWFHLFEAMHPGWWERTNRRMEREQGRAEMGSLRWSSAPRHRARPRLILADTEA
jgi:hypothetical protein